jgi:hypothetical protein
MRRFALLIRRAKSSTSLRCRFQACASRPPAAGLQQEVVLEIHVVEGPARRRDGNNRLIGSSSRSTLKVDTRSSSTIEAGASLDSSHVNERPDRRAAVNPRDERSTQEAIAVAGQPLCMHRQPLDARLQAERERSGYAVSRVTNDRHRTRGGSAVERKRVQLAHRRRERVAIADDQDLVAGQRQGLWLAVLVGSGAFKNPTTYITPRTLESPVHGHVAV